MHPAIATVISECFYDGTLMSPAEREAEELKALGATP